MKATEQYFPVVLFLILFMVVLTFESLDEIPKCELTSEGVEQYFSLVLSLESVDEILRLHYSTECS